MVASRRSTAAKSGSKRDKSPAAESFKKNSQKKSSSKGSSKASTKTKSTSTKSSSKTNASVKTVVVETPRKVTPKKEGIRKSSVKSSGPPSSKPPQLKTTENGEQAVAVDEAAPDGTLTSVGVTKYSEKNPFFPFPAWVYTFNRIVVLPLVVYAWYQYSTLDAKFRAALLASIYSVIEFTFYTITTELPDGDVKLTPCSPTSRKGFTTFTQWWGNLLYIPFVFEAYFTTFPTLWMQFIFFPFQIWLLEVIEGYFFMFLFCYNPAWDYRGADAYFHGLIKLSHGKFWFLLAVPAIGLYPWLIQESQVLAPVAKNLLINTINKVLTTVTA